MKNNILNAFWAKVWGWLETPLVYRWFRRMVDRNLPEIFAERHVRARPGMKILDIGCGPGDFLRYLHGVEYVGFDNNPAYIQAARKRYGHLATFLVRDLRKVKSLPRSRFDLVLAKGLIHHLADPEARHLLVFAWRHLKPGGRFVGLEGVYTPTQGFWARYFVSRDRGRHVRTLAEYRVLVRSVFRGLKTFVYDGILRFPYTLLVIEATRPVRRNNAKRPRV